MPRSRLFAIALFLAGAGVAALTPVPVLAASRTTEAAILTRLRSKNPLVRIEAAADIEDAGLKDPRLAEALIDSMLNDDNAYAREFTAGALNFMRDQALGAVPRVIAILLNRSTGDSRRARAAQILGAIGIAAPDSVDPLAEVLGNKSNSEELRESAAVALTYFGSLRAGDVVERAETVAFSPSEKLQLRILAVEVLAITGPDGANAIPSLESLLSDRRQNLRLREKAADALGKISSDAQVNYAAKTLTAVLTDTTENTDVRTAAVQALQNIRTGASEALPALCRTISEPGAQTTLRLATLAAIQQIGQGNRSCSAELLRLAESDAPIEVRARAAQTLGSVGANESEQIELVKLAENRQEPPELRRAAIGSVRLQNPTPAPMAVALLQILRDPQQDPQVRKLAAQWSAGIRPFPKSFAEAFRAIIANIHEDIDLRRGTAYAAGTAGSDASSLVPVLTQTLANSSDALLRQQTCWALQVIRRGGPATLEVLQNIILNQRSNPELRRAALQALGAIASDDTDAQPSVIPTLLRVLMSSQDTQMAQDAANSLGQMDPARSNAVEDLSEVAADEQQDPQTRQSAVSAIGNIGRNYDVTASIPALLKILQNPDEQLQLQQATANAISVIRPPVTSAIPVLIGLLKISGDDQFGQSAISALGSVGQDSDTAAAFLAGIIKDTGRSSNLRASAAMALGRTGLAERSHEDAFLAALSVDEIAPAALQGVSLFGERAVDHGDASSVPFLQKVVKLASANPVLANASDRDKTYVEMIREDASILQRRPATPSTPWATRVINAVEAHPELSTVVALMLAWPAWTLLTLVILWRKPAWLLPVSESASKPGGSLNLWIVKVHWRSLLLLPNLRFHTRSLDAWVIKNADTYRKRFLALPTVRDREIYVDLPVRLGTREVSHFGPRELKDALARSRIAMLVTGEGGAGKTSLASQMARWAIAEDPSSRPTKHLILPVLIPGELPAQAAGGPDSVEEAVRGHLRNLLDTTEPPSPEMVRGLLRHKRILVFVDGFSEMSQSDRARIAPSDPAFNCHLLLITSRNNETFHGIDVVDVQPAPLSKESLSTFVARYLERRRRQDAFGKQEFQQQVENLQRLVGERYVTPLFATLYIDHMTQPPGEAANAPTSIPDLVLRYLNRLNRNVTVEKLADDVVHDFAEQVALCCVRAHFRPEPAKISDVLTKLGGEDARRRLDYLEKVLKLVQVIEPGEHVHFRLDPIAEYLAALGLTGQMNGDDAEWAQLFQELDHADAGQGNAQGFLQALRDCYVFGHTGLADSDTVLRELDSRLNGRQN